MAGDWIKMRPSLVSDYRVVGMADHILRDVAFTNWFGRSLSDTSSNARYVTRNVTVALCVTGLMRVWGAVSETADRNGDDATMANASLEALDCISGLPGFGAAMASVKWVVVEGTSLVFPKFLQDNTLKRERSDTAERQRRYRERQAQTGGALRNGNVTRVTKRREEESREEPKAQDTIHVDSDESTRVVEAAKPEFSGRVERIYDACTWRKEKPREAKKAIVKAGKRVTARFLGDADKAFEFLMARVLAYAKSPYVASTDRQYLPLPASWFNAGRYDDPDDAWNQTRKDATNGTVNRSCRRADGSGTRPGEYEEPRLALKVLNED